MAWKFPSLMMVSILMLTTCSPAKPEAIKIQSLEKQVLLFSNEKNLNMEETYYDALLDFKNQFPGQLKEIQLVNQPNVSLGTTIVELRTSPALLIIENHKIVAKIEGAVSKKQIVKQLNYALVNW